MAEIKKRKRKPPSAERIQAILDALPAEALRELRQQTAAPAKPKKRTGRPIALLTGQKWGSWNIGPRADRPGVFYVALCDCGNIGVVEASLLRRHMSTKCRQCANKHVGKNLPRVASKLKRES